ncbi:toxin glutamine deamidase domain-containing protein [Actinomycetes bacterium KLBMP 9797]
MAPTAEDAASAALDAVKDVLDQIDKYIPVLGWFLDAITDWPEADHVRLYDLAEQYQAAAELYSGHLEDLQDFLTGLDAWQGDGAAQIAREQLQGYFTEVSSMAETLGGIQQYVQGQALEMESMKWMTVVTLVLMIIALIQAIIWAWTGVGAAAGAVAMQGAKVTIQAVAKQLFQKMLQETIRGGIRRMIQTGFRGALQRAVGGALANAAFMGGIKAGIMGIQALQGHDPFVDGWERNFAIGLADSLIAGAIGGPLTFGANSRFVEAMAFGVGQLGDNFIRMGLDWGFRATGNQEWAERNGLYTGMGLGDAFNAILPMTMLGEMLEPGSRNGNANAVDPAVRAGAGNLFGNEPSPAPAPAGANQGSNQGAPAGAPAGLPGGLPGGAPTPGGAPAPAGATGNQGGTQGGSQSGTQGSGRTSTAPSGAPSGSTRDSDSTNTGGSTTTAGTPDQAGGAPSTTDTDGATPVTNAPTPSDGSTATPTPEPTTSDGTTTADPPPGDPVRVTVTPDAPAVTDQSSTSSDSQRTDTAAPGGTPDGRPADATTQSPPSTVDSTTGGSTATPDGTSTTDSQSTTSDGTTTVPSSDGDGGGGDPTAARPDSTATDGSTVDGTSPDGSSSPDSSASPDGSTTPEGSSADGSTSPSDGSTSPSDGSTSPSDGSASPSDGSASDGSTSDGSTTSDPAASTPPPAQPDAGRTDTSRADPARTDSGRSESRWPSWSRRVEARIDAQFTQGAADFFANPGEGRDGVTAPALTPDLVQRALDANPESLNPYGERMRKFIETNFTELDPSGARRPMDQSAITAKLNEIRGVTPSPATTSPSPSASSSTPPVTDPSSAGRPDPVQPRADSTSGRPDSTSGRPDSTSGRPDATPARPDGRPDSRQNQPEGTPSGPAVVPVPGPVVSTPGASSPGGATPPGASSQSGRGGDGSRADESSSDGSRTDESSTSESESSPEPATAEGGSSGGSSNGGDGTTTGTPDGSDGSDGSDPDPHRNDVSRDHFGDLDPEQPGPLGDRYTPGVHDNYAGTPVGFDAKERETANTRAEEGRLVTRLPPSDVEGVPSLEARERTGPDDPGRGVEYKGVSENTKGAVDKQLSRAIDKFRETEAGIQHEGDIVIDGRPGNLSYANAARALASNVGRWLTSGDGRLDQVGKIEVYLGDGSRLVYQDGQVTHVTESGEQVVATWDPEAGKFVVPEATTPSPDAATADGADGEGADKGDSAAPDQAASGQAADQAGSDQSASDQAGDQSAADQGASDPAASDQGGGQSASDQGASDQGASDQAGGQSASDQGASDQAGGQSASDQGASDQAASDQAADQGPSDQAASDQAGDQSATDQGPTDLTSTDPATTDPATTDPATTDPASTDPASTDPTTTDPASTDPGSPVPIDPGTTTVQAPPGTQGDARTSLMDRIRDRFNSLFERDTTTTTTTTTTTDPATAQREAAEQAAYANQIQQAQQQFRQVVENDPQVLHQRQVAQQAAQQAQYARAEAATHTAEASAARADRLNARHEAGNLRQQANQLDPADPNRASLQQQAVDRDRYANQRGADAWAADAAARQAQQRAAAADQAVTDANKRADALTTDAAARHQAAWRFANVDAGAGFPLIDPASPAPVSAVTGRADVPPPVAQNRPYDQPGGLRRPLQADQARLQRALSDGHGGFVRTPDPTTGDWLQLINAFGFNTDPTRTQNCADSVAALFDTFVHGRPTVAAPRTFDGYRGSSPQVPWAGEADGSGRIEDLTGGRFQSLVDDVGSRPPAETVPQVAQAFNQIRQQLQAGGHGSFAVINTGWRSGTGHSWAAVNHNGNIHFIDPQAGRVVTAVDGPNGVRYVDPHTGLDVGNPIHDLASITMMDAIVVDGNARPMPFANNPPGTWNSRPLTPEYLANQAPEVRASDGATNDRAASWSERAQAAAEAQRASQLRQEAQQHGAEAHAQRGRAQDAANRAQDHQAQRDAAWQRATQLDQAAQRHEAAARDNAARAQQYTPDAQQARQWADQHRTAAESYRQQAADQRAQAHQQEAMRHQATADQQRAEERYSNADARRHAADQAAHTAQRAAEAHTQRAEQHDAQYGQRAADAATSHDQRAARAAAEAAEATQRAQQHPADDPARAREERHADHQQRIAHSATQAADHYRAASQHQNSADTHEAAARQHDRTAEQHRQRALAADRDAVLREQQRAAAEAQYQQVATIDQRMAVRFRTQADQFAQARVQAQTQAAQHRQDAHAAAQAADAERAAAAADRVQRDQADDQARQWVDSLRRGERVDPGAPGAAGRSFDPENLPDGLRSRYEALTNPRARAQFVQIYEGARSDDAASRALDGMERGAQARGQTLEDALLDKHRKAVEQQAARENRPPAPPEVRQEIDRQLQAAAQVRARIEAYAQAHPEVRGTERWLKTLNREIAALQAERAGHSRNTPSAQLARDHGNNVRGVEGEVALAERSTGVVEVGRSITVKTPDGQTLKTDIDVEADGGRVWRDGKSYHSFGLASSDFTHLADQIRQQLLIIEYSGILIDGQPPRLEIHFVNGVTPEVAAALEAVRAVDPVTGAELPHRVTIVDGSNPDGPTPPAGGSPAPSAPPAPGSAPTPESPTPESSTPESSATPEDSSTPDEPPAQTGGSIRPRDEVAAWQWAEQAYESFRASDTDIDAIADNLSTVERPDGQVGYSRAEIAQIKQHVMLAEHLVNDYEGGLVRQRFDASPGMAEAWIRLREGTHVAEDLVLLEHELAESNYMRENPDATYAEAHSHANQSHNWEIIEPQRTGEDFNASGEREQGNGDSAGLREGPGDPAGGGVHLRVSTDPGSPAGDREGFAGGEPGGRESGLPVRGGVREDSALLPEGSALAGEGDLRGVADGAQPANGAPPLADSRTVGPSALGELENPRYQQDLQDSLRTENGYLVGADPSTHPYGQLVNDGGPTVAGRGNNCLDTSLAALSSFYGRPEVSLPRWPDQMADGTVDRLTGESGGPDRAAAWLGENWTGPDGPLPSDPAGRAEAVAAQYRALHQQIADAGPGASALVSADWLAVDPATGAPQTDPSGAVVGSQTGHAFVVVFPQGADGPVWWDPQSGSTWPEPPAHLVSSTHTLWSIRSDGLAPSSTPDTATTTDADADAGTPETSTPDGPVGDGIGGTHTASPIPDTGFVPDGRPSTMWDVGPFELHDAINQVLPDDFGGASVRSVTSDGSFVRVETADGQVHFFRPEVGTNMPNVSETTMGSGRPGDPHLVRVNNRVAGEQLPRMWVREISETLQHAAATRRAEPLGLGRRMLDGLRRMFGLGARPTPDPTPTIDPHAGARLDERQHLLRDFHQSPSATEQARIRSEIEGIDRDLARLGHSPANLPPVPEVSVPTAEPAPSAESTHDEMWTDPPWHREGRPPSIDEMIPQTTAEAERWEQTIREELARLFDGREIGDGVRLRVDPTDPWHATAYRDSVVLRVHFVHPERGMLGSATREFRREADGRLVAEHSSIRVPDDAQGGGISRAYNSMMEGWYRYSGVDHIYLRAASTVGAYVWARAGYDWAPNTGHHAQNVMDRLAAEARRTENDVAALDRWMAGDSSVDIDGLRERYGQTDPDALRAEMSRQADGARDILDRAARHPFGTPGYPTPFEVSRAGWDGTSSGPAASWLGKRALLGADWRGVRQISEGGPFHQRGAGPSTTAGQQSQPDATAGQPWQGDPTAGQRPETDATAGQRPETDATAGQRPQTAPTADQRPSTAPAASHLPSTEPAVTAAVAAAASESGARAYREDDPATVQRDQAESRPTADAASTTLRYLVELPHTGYAAGAQQVIDDLAARGYQPVALRSLWGDGRPGGLVATWRDPQTGQQFQVRLATPESAAAHAAARDWLAARRDGADLPRPESTVSTPDGVDGVRMPESTPHQWNSGERLPLVDGEAAAQAVRDAMRPIPAGLDFTGDPATARAADALRAEPGVVRIALHGLRSGEVVVGGVRMSAADFARTLADLHREGRIDLGTGDIRLITCHGGRGDASLAATLARELGREVTGATDRVWTYPDGTEVVASVSVHDGRLPTNPPDGRWRTFGPDGREVATPAPPTTTAPATTTTPVTATPAPVRAPILHRGADGQLHANDDPLLSHRTADGRLHFAGDRPHTHRDPATGRLHHERDPSGTYRSEPGFRLMSELTRRPVPDPLSNRGQQSQPPQHRASEGAREPYPDPSSSDVDAAAARLNNDRQALADLRANVLQPLMAELGIADLRRIAHARAAHAADPAAQARINDLEAAAREQTRLRAAVRSAAAEMRRAAARQVLADRYGISGDAVLIPDGARRSGDFAAVGFDAARHRLVVLETQRTAGTSHTLPDGSRTERGTPEYLRDVLANSPRLHDHLRQHPDLLDALHRALARGDLTVAYHRVAVDPDGSLSTRPLDLDGLDLSGVADRLPPATGRPDPRLDALLHDSAQRVVATMDGAATVADPHTIDVEPARGRPFRLDVRVSPQLTDAPFRVTLGEGGTHRVELSASTVDAMDAAALDRLLARAIGHATGEVSATRGGRLGRFVGLHGGRLAGDDALVRDPAPGRRPRMSHADLVRLGEFEALGRLHAQSTGAQRAAIEAELNRFVERHGLREGAPGAAERAAQARRHLSEPVAALLDEQRAWWRDSDPAVAGTVRMLTASTLTRATITPVPVRGGTAFRVEPEGWRATGRPSFTFEVRSGTVPDGRVAEFRGSGEKKHFVLVVDPARFDLDGPIAEFRFRSQLRAALDNLTATQRARPEEVPQRLADRFARNAPTGASAATLYGAGTLQGIRVVRTLAAATVDLITNNRLSRYVALDGIERSHDRALSQTADRSGIEDGALQRDLDAGFDQVADLAESALGDRNAAPRTVTPLPEATADSSPVPEAEAAAVRDRTRAEMVMTARQLRADPIDHVVRVRSLGHDRYRLVVRGDGNDAVVRVEVARTADQTKIEIEYADGEITFRVPPELGAATPDDFRAAVREAVREAAERQYRVSRDEAGTLAHLEKGATAEIRQALPTYVAGEGLIAHLGRVLVASSIARSAVQALADRILGHRGLDLADLHQRHDAEHTTRMDGAGRRNVGAQIADLSRNGRSVARAILDRIGGSVRMTAPSLVTPPSHRAAVDAVRAAIAAVNTNGHRGTFEVARVATDNNFRVTEVVYRSNELGRRYDVEIRIRFDNTVTDGPAVTPADGRVSRGRFTFVVNENADPARIAETITHIADSVMFDRDHRVPIGRLLREDYLPVGVRGAAAYGVFLATGSVAAGALAGVGAGMHAVSRWISRLHTLRLSDIALNKTVADANADDVTPEDLRERLGEQRDEVADLEARVREIEERLAADPRTAAQVAELRAAYGPAPTPDHVLLPDVGQRVSAFTDLPRGAQVTTVAGADHTFRVTFRGASGRPESLTFELGSGRTDAVVTAHRVNSDVVHALRVDPTATPDTIADGVRDWLSREIERVSHAPSGLPGVRARLLAFARDTVGQLFAASTALAVGTPVTGTNPLVYQAASAGNATVGAATREVTGAAVDRNEAVTAQTRTEYTRRYFGTASEEHLAVFASDADHLVDRTWHAYDRLQQLERIAEGLPPDQRPGPFQHGPVTRPEYPTSWSVDTDPVRRFEQELGREFFADPQARAAADAALGRLVDALVALHGGAHARADIEAMLFSDDFRNAGQVTGQATLDEVRQSGNLRMVMTTFYNGVLESHHPLDLKHLLSDAFRRDDWEARVAAAGLDVEALRPVRDRFLTTERADLMDTPILAGDRGHARFILAEYAASQDARLTRDDGERFGYQKDRRDLETLGVPLHEAEYRALREHDRLTLVGVDGSSRVINPRDHDLRPGEHGPELPLGWVDGNARFDMDPSHGWHREMTGDRGIPVTAGLSGTATRLLTVFDWLRVPGFDRTAFLHAMLGWMLPTGDHSLYEVLRGAQLAVPGLFGDPGRGFTDLNDMVRRLPGLSDDRLASVIAAASALPPAVAASREIDIGEVRAGAGRLDDRGLRRFLDGLPTVPGLDGQPTVQDLTSALGSPGAAQRAALLAYAVEVLGLSPDGVTIDRIGGPGGAKGASGAPVFWVRDAAGARVGVIKVFPNVDEFARELSAVMRLHAEEFSRLDVPQVQGVGVARADDATAGVVISSVAAGRPLDDLMAAVRDAAPAQRAAAVADLTQALHDTGAALAEMHNRPASAGGPVADWFADQHGTARTVASLREWAGHEGFQRQYGFDGAALIRRFDELGAATRALPGFGALVHGDPHPGNFTHDQHTGRVTVIDLESMHDSMDADGRPVGAAALDVGVFERVMSAFAHNFDVAPLLPSLRRAFLDGYASFGGRALPEAALRYYRAAGLALALHGTRRMLYGEAPRDPSITAESLARRADEQLAEIQDLLRDPPPTPAGPVSPAGPVAPGSGPTTAASDSAAPVSWGADDRMDFDPNDLDPNPRPGETADQADERVELARIAKIYNDLGPEPPRVNLAANDAAHAGDGAHTVERHGPTVPLHRGAPNVRTVEGRIYGDSPWQHPENYSYRWSDVSTMNRVVNEYLQENWSAIRDDLALKRMHKRVVRLDNAVGEGFYNRGMYGAGPTVAQYHVTSVMEIKLNLVPGSDPARPFVVTAFPTGRGF